MEVGEFFTLLFGEKQPEETPTEPTQTEPTQTEPEPTEPEPTEPKTTGASIEDVRSIIREEFKSMMSEAMQKKEEAQKAARAASSIPVPEENKRTVDDIMAERYLSAMGAKKEKEGK